MTRWIDSVPSDGGDDGESPDARSFPIRASRPVILVVEDDEEMNGLERELLAIHGLDSCPAYDGIEALDICRRRNPDVVLLDIMLPRLDGLETCRRLKRSDGTRPPVVLVTALDREDWRNRGYDAGAEAYFAKPFDPNQLVETIRTLLGTVG